MLNKLISGLMVLFLVAGIGGVGYEVVLREATNIRVQRILSDAERIREDAILLSVSQAYAAPALEIADNLSTENSQLQRTLMAASERINELELVLATAHRTLEASVRSLQDQIEEGEFYMEHIEYLENLLDDLIDKLPEGEEVEIEKLEDKEEPYWDDVHSNNPQPEELSGRYHLRRRTNNFYRRAVV